MSTKPRRSRAVVAALAQLEDAARLLASPAADVAPDAPVVRLSQLLQLIERAEGGRLTIRRGHVVLDCSIGKLRGRRATIWPTLAVLTK